MARPIKNELQKHARTRAPIEAANKKKNNNKMGDEHFQAIVGAIAVEVPRPPRVWLVPDCPAGSPTRVAVGVLRDVQREQARDRYKELLNYDASKVALLLRVRGDSVCVPFHVPLTTPNSGLSGGGREGLLRDAAALAQAQAPAVLLLHQPDGNISMLRRPPWGLQKLLFRLRLLATAAGASALAATACSARR